ncbi:MAG: ABC transporter ATP-binding protein [Aliidongia sp.]
MIAAEHLGVRVRPGLSAAALLRGHLPKPLDILIDVSLAIAPGETLALVGESGSGKTTLGRTLNGLVRPVTGVVRFEGEVLGPRASDRQLRPLRHRVAMIFQDAVGSLDPRLRVRDLVTEPLRIQRIRPEPDAAEKLLAQVGLPEALAERYPHELSGGQARRVTVARNLAVPPRLIICDEPTAGLDVSVQAEIVNLLVELQRRLAIAYLVITHDLAVARRMSRRIAVMYLGSIVETGPTAEVFAQPRHPYSRALFLAEPSRDPAQRHPPPLDGEVPSLQQRPSGCVFQTRCPHVQDLCRQAAPEEREIAPGHLLRCHFPLGEDPA